MAQRSIVIQIGQSNASPIGDLKSWQDVHPWLAIGSAATNRGFTPGYSQGSKEEKFRLSSKFAGGPTIDERGSYVAGSFQEVDIRGRAISGTRFLTLYNPTPSFNTFDTFATCYPGRAEITAQSRPLPWRFVTNHQANGGQLRERVASVAGQTVTMDSATSFVDGVDLVVARKLRVNDRIAVSSIDYATETITTATPHGLVTNDVFTIDGPTIPGALGIESETNYWAEFVSTTELRVREESSGAVIDLVSSGSISFDIVKPIPDLPAEVEDNAQVWLVVNVSGSTLQLQAWPQTAQVARAAVSFASSSEPFLLERCELGTITRRRTGTTHRAAYGVPGSTGGGKLSLSVHPPFLNPAPSVGEQFDYPVVAGDGAVVPGFTASTTGPMLFRTWFGGLADVGEGTAGNCRIRMTGTSSSSRPVKITCPGMLFEVGQIVSFTDATASVPTVAAFQPLVVATVPTASSNLIFVGAAEWLPGDRVTFKPLLPSQPLPSPLVANQPYYVLTLGGGVLTVSETKGGSAVVVDPAFDLFAVTSYLPEVFDARGTVYYVTRRAEVERGVSQTLSASVLSSVLTVAIEHGLGDNERILVTGGDLPAEIRAGVVYFARRTASGSMTQLQLSETHEGPLLTLTGGTSIDFERIEDPFSFYVSTSPGGEEVSSTTSTDVFYTSYIRRRERIEGSLSGLRARCISASNSANVGKTVDLAHCEYLSDSTNAQDKMLVHHEGEWPTVPQDGDVFVIEPPPLDDGTPVPFEKFAECLPWSPLEGRAHPSGHVANVVNIGPNTPNSLGEVGIALNLNAPIGSSFQLFSRDPYAILPHRLEIGKDYYVTQNAGGAIYFSETYDGTNVDSPQVDVLSASYGPAVNDDFTAAGSSATLTMSSGATPLASNDPVQLTTTGTLPSPFVTGKTYWVVNRTPTTVQLSYTRGGAAIVAADTGSGTHTMTDVVDFIVTSSATNLEKDYPILLRDTLPSGLTAGTTYYVRPLGDGFRYQLAASRGGSAIDISAPAGGATLDAAMFFPGSSSTVYAVATTSSGYGNPYPPGFNYANQVNLPGRYQPFFGPSIAGRGGASSVLSTSVRMHDYLGTPVYVLNLAFGGTSLGHKEVIPGGVIDGSATGIADVNGFGWLDLKQQISWSESDPAGCFAVFLDFLDALVLTLKREGNTGKVELVTWIQGEEDATYEELANSYGRNLKQFKAAVRQAIKDRGLWPGDASKIPWVQPIPLESFGNYATTVREAIKAEHEADPYARWVEAGDGLEQKAELYGFDEDTVHYTGRAMNILGNRIFDAWERIVRVGRDEVDICNLALAHLGDTARLVTLDDDTRQAELCRQYYDLARDGLLEMHRWEWATRRITLETTTKEDTVTQWDYAYLLPDDWLDTISILPPNAPDDYWEGTTRQPVPYAIELDSQGDRVLLSNEANASMRYTTRVVDTTKFSASFVKALSWYLASMLAGPLIKGEEGSRQAQIAENRMRAALGVASKHDAKTKRKQERRDDYPWRR